MKKYFILFLLPAILDVTVKAQNIAVNTTGTAAASTNMFEVTQTSTAANTVGIYSIHSGAISGTGYGLFSTKTGASTTNIGGFFNASGGTNNYAIIVPSGGGNVGIGTSLPLCNLHILGTAASTSALPYAQSSFLTEGDAANDRGGLITSLQFANPGALYLMRGNGTKASPTKILNGDCLGKLNFGGFDGNSWDNFACVQAYAQADYSYTAPGTQSHPTSLRFFTTPVNDNGSFREEKMRIHPSGNVTIGVINEVGTLCVNNNEGGGFAQVTVWENVSGNQGAIAIPDATGLYYGVFNGDHIFRTGTTLSGNYKTSGTERLRITTAGNVKIGGSSATRATTEGTNHLDIFNGTAPVGTLANGVSLYATAGECRVMDAAGNATLISPHEKETNNWIYYSVNTGTGQVLKIDMEKMMKFLNDYFCTDFVHEFTLPASK
jgi:hypothetical protein